MGIHSRARPTIASLLVSYRIVEKRSRSPFFPCKFLEAPVCCINAVFLANNLRARGKLLIYGSSSVIVVQRIQ